MRLIIASRPAKKLILILFAIALSTGGLLCTNNADARTIRTRDLDPNPVLSPKVGNESKIFYSIPQDAQEALTPGTLVSVMPSGCATKYTSSMTYYDCSGVYFKEYFKGSRLVYMIIDKP